MSVMNVKRGISAHSSAKQESSLKGDEAAAADAAEFKKAFGDQTVGDVANKLADPNWVDPSKKMRTTGNNQLDKDAFMKLMLAQMKNQDPTNPMQSHEMAAQLAQFSSLEQMNNMNTTLDAIKQGQEPNANFQALGLIGKKVSGDSSKLTRAAGDTKHTFGYELMGDAAKVTVQVKDAAGTTVKKIELEGVKKGRNSIDWNGLDDGGLPSRAGEYRVTIDGVAANGQKVWAKTDFAGRIGGVNFTKEGPVLIVDGQTVKMSDVRKIEEAGPMDLMMGSPLPLGPGAAAPLKGSQPGTQPATGKQEEFIPAAQEPDPQQASNLDNIPMDQGLINQLAKLK